MFAGSRGGVTRARVMKALMERPMNANQLAEALALDYTTIQHHLRVLAENGLVHGVGPNYGRAYFWTEKMESFADAFASILEKLEGKRPAVEGNPR